MKLYELTRYAASFHLGLIALTWILTYQDLNEVTLHPVKIGIVCVAHALFMNFFLLFFEDLSKNHE